MKNVLPTVPKTISYRENRVTNPCEIANVFSNYFPSVADTQNQNISYFQKHFFEYFKHQCNNFIFIQSTDSEEIAKIIYSLNINKASGPFSNPNKVLILPENYIFKQLAGLLYLSFSSCSFSSILKAAKAVVVSKKDSSHLSFIRCWENKWKTCV